MIFINFIAIILIIFAFRMIRRTHKYIRKQKAIVNTYDFYRLRENIVSEFIENENYHKYKEIYKITNDLISHLDDLNYNFFAYAYDKFLMSLLEEKDSLSSESLKSKKFTKKLALIIIKQAKKNSCLIRFAMTKFGYIIFFLLRFPKVLTKYLKKHPELLEWVF